MSAGAFRAAFGPAVYEEVSASRTNWVFRLFNITSWAGVAWVGLGLLGQFAFTGRMLIQWFVSEQNRRSTVPAVFWWLSLVGAGALFAYFTWRQDVVGVLGQASGVVIYVRNLRLIGKERRRAERVAE
ncbi:MAG: lipid-A-disaccharide synthase N-terminal domain-containing protein [Phycisphaeraceae bacterium]|nr:MAG: lipid-A-disaccharide synthase N-terminal domain-containing protein [Phycisphaeraceae bacterium]